MSRIRKAAGFTMLEVLVSMLVLALGVLAAVSVMLQAERASSSGYMRQIATQYAYDMVDRMRANSGQVGAGAYDVASGTAPSTLQSDCQSSACSSSAMATFDKYQWLTDLQNNLPGGTGSISQPAGGAATERVVQVWWNDAGVGGGVATQSLRTVM